MSTSSVLDLVVAILHEGHVAAAMRHYLPAWLTALLPALASTLRAALAQRRRACNPPSDPSHEPGREGVEDLAGGVEAGHLAAHALGGSCRAFVEPRGRALGACRDHAHLQLTEGGHTRSSRSAPSPAREAVQARTPMPLTARDLEQIRRVVREELERALRATPATATHASPDDAGEDSDEETPELRAIGEFARWTVRAARREPGAEEAVLRAEATYRGLYDTGWRRGARRKLGMAGDDPLELEDALRALRLLKRRKPSAPR